MVSGVIVEPPAIEVVGVSAEDWDWGDMEEDFLSPSKRRRTKVRTKLV